VKEKPETEIDNYKYAFLAALGAGAAESASGNGGIATKIAKTTEFGVELKSASHGGHEGREVFEYRRVTWRVRALTAELRRRWMPNSAVKPL